MHGAVNNLTMTVQRPSQLPTAKVTHLHEIRKPFCTFNISLTHIYKEPIHVSQRRWANHNKSYTYDKSKSLQLYIILTLDKSVADVMQFTQINILVGLNYLFLNHANKVNIEIVSAWVVPYTNPTTKL